MSEHDKLIEKVALEIAKRTCSIWVQTWHRDLAREIIATVTNALATMTDSATNGERG